MKTKLLIILSFVALNVSAQIQNFNTKVKFNNVDVVDSANVDYIYTVGSNGIMTKVLKSQIGGSTDLSNYYTKPETEDLVSDSLSNYIPLTGTNSSNLVTGNIMFSAFNGIESDGGLSKISLGDAGELEIYGDNIAFFDPSGANNYLYLTDRGVEGVTDHSMYYVNTSYVQKKYVDDNKPNLTAGTNVTIDGTYPNLTINSTGSVFYGDPTYIPFTNVTSDGFDYNSQLSFDSGTLTVGTVGDGAEISGVGITLRGSGNPNTKIQMSGYAPEINLTNNSEDFLGFSLSKGIYFIESSGLDIATAMIKNNLDLPKGLGSTIDYNFYMPDADGNGGKLITDIQVYDLMPTLSNQFIVGNGTTQIKRGLIGSDIGISGSGVRIPTWDGSWGAGVPLSQTAVTANTIPMRTTTGALTGNTATNPAELTRLDQTTTLTGNQTIAGVKTFSSSPIVPTATLSTQAVNLGQLDAAISGNTLQQVIDNSTDVSDNLLATFPSGGVIQDDGGDGIILQGGITKYLLIGTSNAGSITFQSDRTEFLEATNEKGIEYADDYSVNYTDRTLVDKGSVGQIVIDFLKALPTYNASTAQVLGHDASGNLQWVAP